MVNPCNVTTYCHNAGQRPSFGERVDAGEPIATAIAAIVGFVLVFAVPCIAWQAVTGAMFV